MQQLLIACAVAALCTAQSQAPNDQELQAALNEALAKKLVFLKHPCPGPRVYFDAKGQCVRSVKETSWTTDGVIEIDKVTVTSSAIELTGSQVVVTFRVAGAKMEQKFTRGQPVRIVIDRDDSDWPVIVQRMFVTASEVLSDHVPEYWKGFLNYWEQSGAKDWDEKAVSSYLESVIPFEQQIANADGTVRPPKPISTPDPSYDAYAKRAKYQGSSVLRVILDKEGSPRDIQILRPLGFGLDEKAIAAVKRWRFKPATRNGEPVAVRVSVEVNFRLY